MSKKDNKKLFQLEGSLQHTSEGLRHFRSPPKIRGGTKHGVKPSVTFYFNTEKEKQEVIKFFRMGKSRIPSGRELLRLIHGEKESAFEWVEK